MWLINGVRRQLQKVYGFSVPPNWELSPLDNIPDGKYPVWVTFPEKGPKFVLADIQQEGLVTEKEIEGPVDIEALEVQATEFLRFLQGRDKSAQDKDLLHEMREMMKFLYPALLLTAEKVRTGK